MGRARWTPLAPLLLAALAGCENLTVPAPARQAESSAITCSRCHGDERTAAPPRTALGVAAPNSEIAVGAHRSHVLGGQFREGIACAECHVTPDSVDAPAHMDGLPAEVTFGPLARSNGAAPAWDRAEPSCSATYCHGTTLSGGSNPSPIWTRVDGTQAFCGSCHGVPPPPPHVQGITTSDCAKCHPGTVRTDGSIDLARRQHVNGKIDVGGLGCVTCHGSEERGPAPPRSTTGGVATSDVTVGAHASHLRDGALRQALACSECHVVPDTVRSPGHVDAPPAEVTFGALARTGGATPLWNRATLSCGTVYCHGTTVAGGTNKQPVWTRVDGSQAACGTCHGAPPPQPHIQNVALADCGKCHQGTVRGDGTIDVARGLHIDGQLQVSGGACNACHGGDASPAPPRSTTGAMATTDVAVGAHASHLRDGAVRKALSCADCHVVPSAPSSPGHIDTPPAEVTFGALARSDGAAPVWDRGTMSCGTVYCHGATVGGGSNDRPVWTRVDGSQAACGTCHGAPPPAPHPQGVALTDCGKCHQGTVRADGTIDVAGGLHVDGRLQVSGGACNACHGSDASPAPPRSTTGAVATTEITVGAHASHLRDGAFRKALACADCHVVPASVGAPTHIDTPPAEVTFGALARSDGAAPQWNRGTMSCGTVYCHGATRGGGSNKEPVWTRVDGTQASCGSCHGVPPPAPHIQNVGPTDCGKCHQGTVNPNGTIDVAGGLHIDGKVQVAGGACNACHGSDSSPAPPRSTTGAVATTDVTVGAHASHLRDGRLRKAIACNECHRVPDSPETPGHVDASPAEITFGALARSNGATPSWDRASGSCSGVYCHGSTRAGGTNKQPIWTRVDGTQTACGTCHGAPPPAPHPQSTSCSACHPGTVTPSGAIDLAGGLHMDGKLQVQSRHPPGWASPGSATFHGAVAKRSIGECQGCHGTSLEGGNVGVSCSQCHSDWKSSCTFCHGDRGGGLASPPRDTSGIVVTTSVTVGAHASHVRGASGLSRPIACATCHAVPTDALTPAHLDPAPAEVRFSGLATAGGAAPTFNRASASCSASYCHGNFPGGNRRAPVWTRVGAGEASCGSCHGRPPGTGEHQKHIEEGRRCSDCHAATVDDAGAIIDPGRHVNGVKDVVFKRGGSFNGRNCTAVCHESESWND